MGENGIDLKYLREEWDTNKEYVMETFQKINETHSIFQQMVGLGEKLLEKLDKLDKLHDIEKSISHTSEKIQGIEQTFVTAIIGKNQLPITSANQVFKVFGWIIMGLVLVIVYLLTGKSLGWVPSL